MKKTKTIPTKQIKTIMQKSNNRRLELVTDTETVDEPSRSEYQVFSISTILMNIGFKLALEIITN